ncbi:MAG: DegQ family serine endoprotease [Planctomycetota bacterium]
MQRQKLSVCLLLVALVAAFCVFGLPVAVRNVSYAVETGKALAAREALTGERFKVAEQVSQAFQDVAKAVGPSVVNIESSRTMKTMSLRHHGMAQPPEEGDFRGFLGDDLFKNFFDMPGQAAPDQRFEQRGMGSGLIVSADGYVLTNNHVVSDADNIEVKLSGGKNYPAKVVGTDRKTDLAVLKIDAKDLIPAQLGNSDNIQIGEWVLAIGNPFNLDHTVTQGIVSAKGRSNVGITDYEDFLQTDAAINPGNSGGPLVNLHGEVIGINTAIASQTGSFAGVGFAIPINRAKAVKDSLISKGHVERGWLGVLIQNLDEDMAKSFGYEGTKGALVGNVNKGSPAEKAGMKDGDIVTKYGGKPVENVMQLREYVASTNPNSKVEIEVFRDGKRQMLAAQVTEQEAQAVAAGGSEPTDKLGLTLQNLTPESAQKLGLADQKGVYISEVEPGSLAAHAGLHPGDVVTGLNGVPVNDLSAFQAEIKKHDLKLGLRLQVRSEGMNRYLMLKDNHAPQQVK